MSNLATTLSDITGEILEITEGIPEMEPEEIGQLSRDKLIEGFVEREEAIARIYELVS